MVEPRCGQAPSRVAFVPLGTRDYPPRYTHPSGADDTYAGRERREVRPTLDRRAHVEVDSGRVIAPNRAGNRVDFSCGKTFEVVMVFVSMMTSICGVFRLS